MSTLKLNGATSGSSIIKAPDSGSTGQTFTLPASSGTLAKTSDIPSGITSSADATAITIDSSESVGIDNSTGFGTYSGTGVKYSKGDGTFFVGRDGGQPLWLNRETSQGDLIGLAAAGSTYARIGTDSNDLVLKTGTGGNTERMRITSDGRSLSNFTAKAWVRFNGIGTPAIQGSHNVSSITDNGTGLFTVNYSNNMGGTNYTVATTGENYSWDTVIKVADINNMAVGSCRLAGVRVANNSLEDSRLFCMAVFGGQ